MKWEELAKKIVPKEYKQFSTTRNPKNIDYTDIEGDVKRRDLTINALFYDLDREEIVDLVGGISDLKKKQVRTVGNPEQRFDEDPLRKLRALRFYGQLAGKVHSDTYQALKKDPSLKGVSAERIQDEFHKGIKKAQSTKKYLELADKLKILPQIFPGLKIQKPFIDENNWLLQLAYLLQDNNPSELIKKLNSLKYSNEVAKNVAFLVSLKKFNPDKVFDFTKMRFALSLPDLVIIQWGRLIGKDLKKFAKFNLSVSGKDAPKDLKGKEIGNWIKKKETDKFLSEGIQGKKLLNLVRKEVEKQYGETYTEKEFTPIKVNHGWCDIWAEVFIKENGGKYRYTDISDGTGTNGHAWVEKGNKFYDAEKPNGVNDIFKLPYFQRAKKYFGKEWNEEKIRDFIHEDFSRIKLEFLAEAVIGKWRSPDVSMIERAIKNRNYVGIYYEEDEESNTISGFRLIEPYVYGTGFVHSVTNEVSHQNDGYLRAFIIMSSKNPKLGKRKSVSKSKSKPHWRMLRVERIKKWINLEKKFKGNRPLYNSQDKNIYSIKASV